MVQKVAGSIPVSHPTMEILASVVQWLVCKFSKLEMRVQFSPLAPSLDNFDNVCYNGIIRAFWARFFVIWGGFYWKKQR